MPRTTPEPMPETRPEAPAAYNERLSVPLWWWPAAFALGGFLGAQLYAGLGWIGAVVTYAVLTVAITSGLLFLSRLRIVLRDNELTAGREHIPVGRVTGVRTLDSDALRVRMGPDADTRAVLVTRPWIRTAVELSSTDGGARAATRAASPPYWLVSTRRPAELAELVRQGCGAPSQHGST